jgi:hypothetical protein
MGMLRQLRHDDLRILSLNLQSLISRIALNPKGKTPLLPKGGSGIFLTPKYLPRARKLSAVVDRVYQECMRLINERYCFHLAFQRTTLSDKK